jgi:hypothetical protein
MSEYQYYEFAAIDRPLSVEEQAGLRAIPGVRDAGGDRGWSGR